MELTALTRLEKLRREQLEQFSNDELRTALETLRWWKALKASNNDTFLPLFFDRHRYLILKGGGGSGKSVFAGRKVLERATGEEGHRILVCRKVARTLRDSCFAQLRDQLARHYPDSGAVVHKGDMWIGFPNGSEILFAGLDDVEKLKSIYNITGIWIEEASELLEGDFNQLDIRLRTETKYYKQIILSFNPISVTHWLKKRFFDFDIKDPEARREAIEQTRTHESTYKDNRFLPEESRKTLEAFRYTDEYYYMVYCLGQWGVTGRTVFCGKELAARLEKLPKPVRQGYYAYDYDGLRLSNIQWVEDENGPLRVYREPEEGRPYVIGGDTAGDGSDWFVGQGIDNITGEQVCTLRHKYDEDEYARQMYCLGKAYNEALLAVECNFSTFPVKELQRLGYFRQYVREKEDTYQEKTQKSFGFQTNARTRPVIVGGLVETMRGHAALVNDKDTLTEMLTFVRNPDKPERAEAENGANDDCVMALAIAHYARGQQSMKVKKKDGAAPESGHPTGRGLRQRGGDGPYYPQTAPDTAVHQAPLRRGHGDK